MPLDLPAPDKTQLDRSPLALVVCQVRFENVLAVSDSRTMRLVHEALGDRSGPYPRAEPLSDQGVSIQLGAAGATTAAQPLQTGWRLRSRDGGWSVALMPSHVALETTAYTTWSDDFRPRLAHLIEATAKHIAPETEQRLGLRYINRITAPPVTRPREWQGHIAPELLGVVLHNRLGPGATAAQQQVDLEVDDGTQCSFRHGFFTDPARNQALTYVLDFDVYREGVSAFDPGDIMTTADAFNTVALQLFQQAITPQLRALLAKAKEVGHE